jgi:hypothetical protein
MLAGSNALVLLLPDLFVLKTAGLFAHQKAVGSEGADENNGLSPSIRVG